ncbi:hypothetical protein LEP1GSC198_3188 [Leptospira kirschneri str. JB]|nr:hypothetical protein LEP1GSC198_3188 [Leptospira kirschneri str. JB]
MAIKIDTGNSDNNLKKQYNLFLTQSDSSIYQLVVKWIHTIFADEYYNYFIYL